MLSLFSTRVPIDSELASTPWFAPYVAPQDAAGNTKVKLFVVGRKDRGKGRQDYHHRLVLFYQGALVCECKPFHQKGFWCKHCMCLVGLGKIDFSPTFAVLAKLGADPSSQGLIPSVSVNPCDDILHVFRSIGWGVENSAAHAENTFFSFAQSKEMAVIEASREKSRAKQFEDDCRNFVALCKSHAWVKSRFVEFMEKTMQELEQQTVGNPSRRLNPPSLNNNNLHSTENKSYRPGAG